MALKDEIAALRAEVSDLKKEVGDLRRFNSWLLGCVAGVGAIIAFAADAIRKRLGLA